LEEKTTVLPSLIRVSTGTAIVLDLLSGKLDAQPTTAYLMTYREGKCTANCGFCPQASGSKSSAELLSRITWPKFPTRDAVKALSDGFKKGKIKRVCIQALNYPEVFVHLEALVKEIKKEAAVPVSVSCQPRSRANIELLKHAGVDRLGVPLDAATQPLFNVIKGKNSNGPYRWDIELLMLSEALAVFGRGKVSTHLIIGLGETEREATETVQKCVDMEILPALFAFTPVRGTTLEKKPAPPLDAYRRVQLARYLIVKRVTRAERMMFDREGRIEDFGLPKEVLEETVNSGEPFRTSGCRDCNRPFYNEKPGGPIYNFPRVPTKTEIEAIKAGFKIFS